MDKFYREMRNWERSVGFRLLFGLKMKKLIKYLTDLKECIIH